MAAEAQPGGTDPPEGEFNSAYFRAPERRLGRFPRLAREAFSIVWKSARRELVQCVALQILIAAATAGELVLLERLLSHLVGHTTSQFSSVLPDVGGIAGLTVSTGVASALLSLRSRVLSLLVSLEATDRVVRAAVAVELIVFDDPTFHNQLQRASQAASTRPAQMVQEVIGFAGSTLSIAAIGGVLLVLQPLFFLLILLAYIPIWVATNRSGHLGYRATVEQTERDRMRFYLFDILTTKAPAQEVRSFALGDFLADRHYAVHLSLIDGIRAVLLKRLRVAVVGQVLSGLLTVLALGLLVLFVTQHEISVSAAGAAAGAMVLLSTRLHALATSSVGMYENSLYMGDYVSFTSHTPRPERQVQPGAFDHNPAILEASHVSFTYPGGRGPSLQDASLTLRRGEVVALVGENGSGKTTFAKLLAGLFTPSEGIVSWDGVDLASLEPVAIRKRVGIIFQDFMRYTLPAYDNVAFGSAARYDQRAQVEEAAAKAGVGDVLQTLRQGYETVLGPAFFGGTDLSGGQWQRIALARLFFRDAPLVILDEPTASLDPRAEAELFDGMRRLFSGRGVLLVTHRFSSARQADRIYVLREGRVHETGTHAELIARDGFYAELYELQARSFRD